MKIALRNKLKGFLSITTCLLFFTYLYPLLQFSPIQATQLTPISDTLSDTTNYNPDVTSATGIAHSITFTATSAIAAGKQIIVYFQCNATAAQGFNTITATSELIRDTTTSQNLFSGAGSVGSCTSGNVSTFSGSSFIAVTATTATNSASVSDSITISGISATNPNTAATTSAPFVIDVKDNNATPDEGYVAIPISSSTQVTVTGVVTPYITLSLTNTTIAFGNFTTGVNTSGTTTTLSTSTNAIGGETVSVWDAGKPADSVGTAGGLWSASANHKIPCPSNTGSGTATTTSTEQYGINGGSGSATSGTFSVQAPFNNGTTTTIGGFLKDQSTTFASASAPINGGSSTINWTVGILPTTQAGSYTDTVTFSAVGSF